MKDDLKKSKTLVENKLAEASEPVDDLVDQPKDWEEILYDLQHDYATYADNDQEYATEDDEEMYSEWADSVEELRKSNDLIDLAKKLKHYKEQNIDKTVVDDILERLASAKLIKPIKRTTTSPF